MDGNLGWGKGKSKRLATFLFSFAYFYSFPPFSLARPRRRANDKAAEEILASNSVHHEDKNTLDLHGLHVSEAVSAVVNYLQRYQGVSVCAYKTTLDFKLILFVRGVHQFYFEDIEKSGVFQI